MASPQKTLRVSFSPLLLAGAAYLTQTALKASLKNPNINMDSSPQVNSGLFDPKGSYNQSIEASDLANLEVFGDYLTFMMLSIIFNLMMMLFSRVKEFLSRQFNLSKAKHCQLPTKDTTTTTSNDLTSFEGTCEDQSDRQEMKLIKFIKPLIKAALCYTLAFCFFKIALFCAFTFYTSRQINHHLQPLRTLGEEGQETLPILQNKTPEKISLAVGRVLASFDVEPTIIAMSQDEKWAFVSTENPQLIRVYDTSDFKAPKQVTSLDLGRLSRSRMFLELSADGTLLIASNYVDVKIIDVSNPRAPKVIGSFESPMYYSSDQMVFVSMAISPDNKYLFMAEVGFAILDISNPAEIVLAYSSVKRSWSGYGNLVSLSASRDRDMLYLANGKGTLEVYNVENPYEPKMINQIVFPDSTATSVFLSKYYNLAYIAGMSGKKLAINVLDVSDPLEIKQVSNFTVSTIRTTTPIIQAISPHETKLYIVQQKLMIIDLISMSAESNNENLVKNSLLSICFSATGRYAGVAYLEQIAFVELFTNYPNLNIFTPSNSSTASFVMDQRFESWSVNHDGNVLFLAVNDYQRLHTSFEIWNLKNKDSPYRITALTADDLGVNLTAPFLSFKMSPDNKRVYLKWWTWQSSKLIILDVSGNLKTPVKLKEYTVPLSLNFEDFAFSKNEKTLCIAPSSSAIVLYDLEGPEQNIITLPFVSELTLSSSGIFCFNILWFYSVRAVCDRRS